ncbi:MAG: hypothetical protein HKN03_13255 [Acidimicrobiales bacterium]|nr:hypothetical protein [Acidimicrobiales bacterium]
MVRSGLMVRGEQLLHLAKRFFQSLSKDPPAEVDDRWIRSQLLPGETALWERLSAPDQRHAVQVARTLLRARPDAPRPVIAAAVLHDVGKVVSGYGTIGRVAATVFWVLVPRSIKGGVAHRWSGGDGFGRKRLVQRLAEYRLHPELGRDLLVDAGSDPLTSNWAAEHHTPSDRWTVSVEWGAVLKECDDD